MTQNKNHYKAKDLETAFKDASFLEFENGMATFPVIVERQFEKVKVIRKCGNCERPEIFLIIAKPKDGYKELNLYTLEDDIKDALGLYGDISINFKKEKRKEKGVYDCIINAFFNVS